MAADVYFLVAFTLTGANNAFIILPFDGGTADVDKAGLKKVQRPTLKISPRPAHIQVLHIKWLCVKSRISRKEKKEEKKA